MKGANCSLMEPKYLIGEVKISSSGDGFSFLWVNVLDWTLESNSCQFVDLTIDQTASVMRQWHHTDNSGSVVKMPNTEGLKLVWNNYWKTNKMEHFFLIPLEKIPIPAALRSLFDQNTNDPHHCQLCNSMLWHQSIPNQPTWRNSLQHHLARQSNQRSQNFCYQKLHPVCQRKTWNS